MDIKKTIITRLHEIEAEHRVKILLAVEAGSRAWGFESSDSDYDIRFIYKHELSWYLNVLPKRDVIEYPEANLLDISGWDLRKALFLLNKSNPALFEWLNSPIVYIKDAESFKRLSESAKDYFSPKSSIHHYLHMAGGNFRDYLQRDMVKIKKYFYVLRPLLACMWIEKYSSAPPMNFQDLLVDLQIGGRLNDSISTLLERKRSAVELGLSPIIPEINNFIQEKIEYFADKSANLNPAAKPPAGNLDKLFCSLLFK
ncbi:MAG: nucleotidyltransferase domain-containing protein [Spirochaetales bacterium]|nr:nucleotidyltransferase domain-containing protein [Spirochaetales bacterium]